MRLLVTGITGFLGKNLINNLPNDCDLLAIANSKSIEKYKVFNNIKYINCNFENFTEFSDDIIKFNPEIVLNLAWKGIPNFSLKNSKYNIEKTMDFFDFISEKTLCSKFISIGSCAEYFNPKGETDENYPKNPKNDFTWAKITLDKYLTKKCNEKNIKYINLKLFYVYGRFQRDDSLIPYLIKTYKNKTKPEIKNPFNSHDFIHIDDVISAIWGIIDNDKSEGSYNIGSGESISIYEVNEIIRSEMKISDQIKLEKQNSQTPNIDFYANNKKIKDEINWIPKINIIEGIKNCIP